MAETTVGLFQNEAAAHEVVAALKQGGIASDKIRTVKASTGAAVDNAMSTPGTDFALAVGRDLSAIGANEAEREYYLSGLKRGNVLVFATGTTADADAAAGTMNEYGAIEVEEFAGAVATGVGEKVGSVGNLKAINENDVGLKADRKLARTAGAKVFSW